jgi:hypothetical protein
MHRALIAGLAALALAGVGILAAVFVARPERVVERPGRPDRVTPPAAPPVSAEPSVPATGSEEVVALLRAIRAEIEALRRALESSGASGPTAIEDEDWAHLRRQAQARRLADELALYRQYLCREIVEAEADIEDSGRKNDLRGVAIHQEYLLACREALGELEHLRSFDELERWRLEHQIRPLR